MKAVCCRTSGGLTLEEMPVPECGEDAVLIKVSNTGFCGSDHSLIESGMLADGAILGHEVSGTVAAFDRKIEGLRVGERVMVRPTYCGRCRECLGGRPHLCGVYRRTIGIGDLPGAFAEYLTVYRQMVIPVPDGVDSRNAALAETFASALHGIRLTGREGGSALVIGGGAIGLSAVMLLKLLGYYPIFLSEPVKEKRTLGEKFGADRVIDPITENVKQTVFEGSGGSGFDIILECSGLAENVPLAIDIVSRGGTICMIGILFGGVTIPHPMMMNFKEIRVIGSYSNTHQENIECLKWMAEGKIDARSLISDLISLEELPQTYRTRIHTGKALKVMLRIGEEF